MGRRGLVVLSFVLPAVTVPIVASCGDGNIYVYIVSDAGADATDSTDAGEDGSEEDAGDEDAGPSCSADCVRLNPTSFSIPLLLWVGPDPAPECPFLAPIPEPGVLLRDLIVPAGDCPSCDCKPSTGSCALPTVMTAHAAICQNLPAPVDTSFDPPPAWDGSCSADNAIPAQAQCPPGSGTLCAQSLTIGALTKVDEKCEPDLPPIPKITEFAAPSWGLVGVACQGYTDPPFAGCGPGAMCVPMAEPGFRHCVKREGDHACPDEGYTDKVLFYGGVEDTRGCNACSCGPPEGGLCTATVSVFKDAACTDPLFLGLPAASDGAPCHDIISKGQPLGSKSAPMSPTTRARARQPEANSREA
jgi:hypothetical protein